MLMRKNIMYDFSCTKVLIPCFSARAFPVCFNATNYSFEHCRCVYPSRVDGESSHCI